MINNITDIRMPQQANVVKTSPSLVSFTMPPILGFKTPLIREKALLRVNKIKRGDNIAVCGVLDDDYYEVAEEEIEIESSNQGSAFNFFAPKPKLKRKFMYLKNCYVIDYIQSPRVRCGLGTEAIKHLAEKAFFDPKAQGRIVTFSTPVCKESSPAIFFYKLGFRFMDPSGNKYIQECIEKKTLDIPPQTGMMYLPKSNIHKLLRYGEMF